MTAKLYGWIASIVVLLLIVGAIYAKGRLDASHAAETANLKRDLETAMRVAYIEKRARQQDSIKAAEDAKRQAALQTKIGELNDYVDTLEDRNRECLSSTDTQRVRDLW